MVTYLYWAAIIALAFGLFYFIGYKMDEWKIAAIACFSILTIGFIAYHFLITFISSNSFVLSTLFRYCEFTCSSVAEHNLLVFV